MLKTKPEQPSFYSLLYDKIPKDHILKKLNIHLDFSFINQLLASQYCRDFGRPAWEPEFMVKILFLQKLYNLSDEKIIEDIRLNLAFMYFLEMNPEDEPPERSLLSKFRTFRLNHMTLDEIMAEIVQQCVEKGLIKGTKNGISIDSTHTLANTRKKMPEQMMRSLARKIIRSTIKDGADSSIFPEEPKVPATVTPQEEKAIMQSFLVEIMNRSESYQRPGRTTKKMLENARELLKNPAFLAQTGPRSLVDKDARVGRKSREISFFGYKTEFAMTTEERIITAVRTHPGSYADGDSAKELMKITKNSGVNFTEVYGDKAYFRKPILDAITEANAKAYIPVSELVYRVDETNFSYNKDADVWSCAKGNMTDKKTVNKSNRKLARYSSHSYYFTKAGCQACEHKEQCAGKKSRRRLNLGVNAAEFYEISQEQKKEEFKLQYRKRATIEGKNAELKRFHGLDRAKGYGLLRVSMEAKLAAIAANLKRIAAMS